MTAPGGNPILAGTSRPELREILSSLGEPAYRGDQLADHLYRRFELDWEKMKNLPRALRQRLADEFLSPATEVVESVQSADGTEKMLLRLRDGECIESVIIPAETRTTFCLSTQVGCPVRCAFCASGAAGLVRNLACGEITEELIRGAAAIGRLPDNIVFMGIGEGLLNFRELASALLLISSPEGFGLSPRRLTVSTSGIVPGIRALAELGKEFNLAISLHATNDELRARLIPSPLRYPIAEILAAADEYRERIGRMVTFEYTLLAGVNDSPAEAEALGRLSRGHHAKINLIAYNDTGGDFKRPEKREIDRFQQAVEAAGGTVTLRRSRGTDRSAACGQLRQQHNLS